MATASYAPEARQVINRVTPKESAKDTECCGTTSGCPHPWLRTSLASSVKNSSTTTTGPSELVWIKKVSSSNVGKATKSMISAKSRSTISNQNGRDAFKRPNYCNVPDPQPCTSDVQHRTKTKSRVSLYSIWKSLVLEIGSFGWREQASRKRRVIQFRRQKHRSAGTV